MRITWHFKFINFGSNNLTKLVAKSGSNVKSKNWQNENILCTNVFCIPITPTSPGTGRYVPCFDVNESQLFLDVTTAQTKSCSGVHTCRLILSTFVVLPWVLSRVYNVPHFNVQDGNNIRTAMQVVCILTKMCWIQILMMHVWRLG